MYGYKDIFQIKSMANRILPKELEENKSHFIIIDVREKDELEEGVIENSIHMPLGLTIKKAKKGMINELKNHRICTHCSSGYRSNIAADELNKWGFNAVSIEGGYNAWKKYIDSLI